MISTTENSFHGKNSLALAIFAVLGLAVIAPSAQAQIVISQVYGGGGATTGTPTYKYDYVELFNNGPSVVDLAASGYTLQYASANGAFSTGNTNTLQGTIASGDYYLVREGSPAANVLGADLTPYNDVGTLNLAQAAGKIALASNNTTITFTAPNTLSANVVDFVGYGTTATTYEGSGPATAPSTTTSIARTLTRGVYVDSNDNKADFTVDNPPNPHTGAYVYVAPTPEPSGFIAMFIGTGAVGMLIARRRVGMKTAA